jgi:hypothetical protein
MKAFRFVRSRRRWADIEAAHDLFADQRDGLVKVAIKP